MTKRIWQKRSNSLAVGTTLVNLPRVAICESNDAKTVVVLDDEEARAIGKQKLADAAHAKTGVVAN